MSARELAATIANLLGRVETLERTSQLANSSLDDGSLPVYDADGTLRQTIGQQADGAYTVLDHNADPPPIPSRPVVAPAMNALVVTWDGTTATAVPWATDFRRVEVHISETSGFTPDDTTQVAAILTTKGGQILVPDLTAGTTYYVVLVGVNTSSVESAPTAQVSGVPDAAVDQAQINQINADVAAKSAVHVTIDATEPAGPNAVDDVWFNKANGEVKTWDGSAWVPYQVGAPAIRDNAIATQHVTDEAIDGNKLGPASVTAPKLAVGSVTESAIADLSIPVWKFRSPQHLLY